MVSISRPTRLLNTRNHRLEIPGAAVKYAILSHTWTNEEVTLQDWERRRHGFEETVGSKKILDACAIAEREGYHYLWVDTCCIDKTNTAELGEAIASMFAWYRDAAICYTYLSDVDATISPMEGLRESRWFTRGWTLQELLAPSNMRFLASDWSTLGSRIDLIEDLAVITTIDVSVLAHRKPLSRCSIAQRFSWASKRATTKPEDLAYCLLGVIGVSISPSYGEGGEKAFRRLQEEAWKSSADISFLAWRHVEPTRASALFAASPKDFSGCGTDQLNAHAIGTEHWTTNLGLMGTFSVVEGQDAQDASSLLVLLGCNTADSLDTCLALRVSRGGETGAQSVAALTVRPVQGTNASLLHRLQRIPHQVALNARSMRGTILFRESAVNPRKSEPTSTIIQTFDGVDGVSESGTTHVPAKPNPPWRRSTNRICIAACVLLVVAVVVGGAVGGVLGKKAKHGADQSRQVG
jgi:hypothetical protein